MSHPDNMITGLILHRFSRDFAAAWLPKVLFKPGESRRVVKGKDVIKEGEDNFLHAQIVVKFFRLF